MANECGSCTVCCRQQRIPDLAKPANVLCDHACATPGGSCSVYGQPQRPDACSSYDCLWLSENMAPNLKPSLIGATFEYTGLPDVTNLRCDPHVFRLIWGNAAVMSEIKRRLLAGQSAVILTDGDRASAFVKDGSGENWGLLTGTLRGLTADGEEKEWDFNLPMLAGGSLH